ncbi:MAG: dehydrogenase [Verrucomicrobia bacterium]|nr:MAG: dehydrogenase [Verrucomicrobiota bacterium]
MRLGSFLLIIFFASLAQAQRGDRGGEVQKPVVPPEKIPPAPVLSPQQAVKSFKLPPGFRLELVASEPLVQDPVQIVFDPDGRIWVVEMRGFMPNLAGTGEDQPVGDVVILEDTDGDGRMDKRTVFQDGLVLPRAVALVRDGALIAEMPHLWFCRDTNGDGKADEKIEIANDYLASSVRDVEHNANGLLWALDNWIYSANYRTRFRNTDGHWQRQPTALRGQWGITQDDFGRLFYNTNPEQLRCDLAPDYYLSRNPNYRSPAGLNVQPVKDQSTWPIRVNPGVNRGYRGGQLRDDFTLAYFTAACGPLIYRGDQFPGEFYGNAFLCEPGGNFVRRDVLTEQSGTITARNAYDKAEFLASTDERFRPVNLNTGPDGALYVVDMYRGVIQHRFYVTSYLRQQIESRGLEQPVHLGRIYRVVHSGTPLGKPARLSKASSAELVNFLSHPNGWWRDTAQRLLIERADQSEGLGKLDQPTLLEAFASTHSKVRAAVIRLCEPFLKAADKAEFLPRLIALATNEVSPDAQLQLALTLGELADPQAETALVTLLRNAGANIYIRDGVISGLYRRELEFLEKLLVQPDWNEKRTGSGTALSALAQCVFREGKPERIDELFAVAATKAGPWQRLAILDGLATTTPPARQGRFVPPVRAVHFPREPAGWVALGKLDNQDIASRLQKILPLIAWPGRPGSAEEKPVAPLTKAQQERFEVGKTLYLVSCGSCHQPTGLGQEGLAPPLLDSEWVAGPEDRLVRIALQGLRGPLTVKGKPYQLDMPSLAVFDDDQIAAVLTYVRREWGHTFPPIEPEAVKRVRAATANREDAWSEAELLKIR